MGRGKKNPFINGHYSEEKCAACAHKWGNHGHAAPHKCTRRDLGCECPEFKEQPKEQAI